LKDEKYSFSKTKINLIALAPVKLECVVYELDMHLSLFLTKSLSTTSHEKVKKVGINLERTRRQSYRSNLVLKKDFLKLKFL
jgi:hypothetical protein